MQDLNDHEPLHLDTEVHPEKIHPTAFIAQGAVVVGDVTLGKVFNTTGDVMNLKEGEKWEVKERRGIHGKAPAFDQLESKTEMFQTGIKVIDLLTPYVLGGKIGLFGGAGVGKTVLIQEMIAESLATTVVCRCSPVSASAPVRATTSSRK